ncbi:MAG TPA: hypothetical protein PLI09_04620 [Candidatus Hydrogenedentes bacterium]|nr:hypothetical protein [Candidatus Hydrogenedentota bacterium]
MLRKQVLLIFITLTLIWLADAWSSAMEEPLTLDSFGGLKNIPFTPSPFFRTHHDGQRWWLVTPEGNAFLSLGVCVVNPIGDTERGTNRQPYRENVLAKHGTVENWTAATRARLQEWGLNTLGAWNTQELRGTVPYTIELSLGSGLWSKERVPDFFSPEAETHIRNGAAGIDAYVNDPYLIGYYLDNELPWSFDWRRLPNLFPGYVALPPEAPGKQKMLEFFRERYQTPERFAAVWACGLNDWSEIEKLKDIVPVDLLKAQEDREAFVLLIARRYFKLTTEAVRAKDTNHLILGCRFVWILAPKPVVQACGEYCDVVSINYYEAGLAGYLLLWSTKLGSMRIPPDLTFNAFHELTQKPLLITEFGFRGMDSGMPNTYPPPIVLQPTVAMQRDRANKFEECATTWMAQPYFLGYHWFEYMDEPKGGRFDGENGNYGLVNIEDEPYQEVVDRFKSVNRRVWDLHRNSAAQK